MTLTIYLGVGPRPQVLRLLAEFALSFPCTEIGDREALTNKCRNRPSPKGPGPVQVRTFRTWAPGRNEGPALPSSGDSPSMSSSCRPKWLSSRIPDPKGSSRLNQAHSPEPAFSSVMEPDPWPRRFAKRSYAVCLVLQSDAYDECVKNGSSSDVCEFTYCRLRRRHYACCRVRGCRGVCRLRAVLVAGTKGSTNCPAICKLQAANTAAGFADARRFGPDPWDTRISKRQWEKLQQEWKRGVKQQAEFNRMTQADQEARDVRDRLQEQQ